VPFRGGAVTLALCASCSSPLRPGESACSCGAAVDAEHTCVRCGTKYAAHPMGGLGECPACAEGTGERPAKEESLSTPESPEDDIPQLLRNNAVIGAQAIREAAAKHVEYEWIGIARSGNVIALAGLPGEPTPQLHEGSREALASGIDEAFGTDRRAQQRAALTTSLLLHRRGISMLPKLSRR
jgi:hypothetical protein